MAESSSHVMARSPKALVSIRSSQALLANRHHLAAAGSLLLEEREQEERLQLQERVGSEERLIHCHELDRLVTGECVFT